MIDPGRDIFWLNQKNDPLNNEAPIVPAYEMPSPPGMRDI